MILPKGYLDISVAWAKVEYILDSYLYKANRGTIGGQTQTRVGCIVSATFLIDGKGEMEMTLFQGCATAIVTPFNEDGTVDFDALRNLIEWQISEGIDALVICGTTGEASTLDDDEQVEVIRFSVEVVNKRVPVLGGAGTNDTRHGVELCKRVEAAGVDGLLLVTPYYNKCSQRGLIEHYTILADSVSIPSIIYSVPGRTAVNILPETVAELAKHPRIVGIKEASGNIAQVVEIARLIPEGFALYSGNDDMVIPLMSVGGIGYISVLGNVIPKDASLMARSYLNGDIETARKLQLSTKALTDSLFADVNPIPVKSALAMMGKCKEVYRLPLCPPSDAVKARIRKQLIEYGVLHD